MKSKEDSKYKLKLLLHKSFGAMLRCRYKPMRRKCRLCGRQACERDILVQ